MTDFYSSVSFRNAESPFTELFYLLKRVKVVSDVQTLTYDSNELKVLYQHANNAMDILLQGIQELGGLMSLSTDKRRMADFKNIGYFISAIGNLTEALNVLRLDTDYVLRSRGEVDY